MASLSVLVALAVASAIAAVAGWQFGVAHIPIDSGCGCGNLLAIPLALVFGALGSVAAVLLVAAVFGAVGLALYLQRGRTEPPTAPVDGIEGTGTYDQGWWLGAETEMSVYRDAKSPEPGDPGS